MEYEALAKNLYCALRDLIQEEKPSGYHDCIDNGTGTCAWCFAEEELEKAELFYKEKLNPCA